MCYMIVCAGAWTHVCMGRGQTSISGGLFYHSLLNKAPFFFFKLEWVTRKPSGATCLSTHLHYGCRCLSPGLAWYIAGEPQDYIVTTIFMETSVPHVLEVNFLSELQLAMIFCHSVGCLFTLRIWLCSSFTILCNLICQLLVLFPVLWCTLIGKC